MHVYFQMPKKKKSNQKISRLKDRERKRKKVLELKLHEAACSSDHDFVESLSTGVSRKRENFTAQNLASPSEKMIHSNALGVVSPQGSLSTVYVCTTPISDSVSLSTSDEVSVSDSVCTPLRVPWHYDGVNHALQIRRNHSYPCRIVWL